MSKDTVFLFQAINAGVVGVVAGVKVSKCMVSYFVHLIFCTVTCLIQQKRRHLGHDCGWDVLGLGCINSRAGKQIGALRNPLL